MQRRALRARQTSGRIAGYDTRVRVSDIAAHASAPQHYARATLYLGGSVPPQDR